jgi:hypothetical protein
MSSNNSIDEIIGLSAFKQVAKLKGDMKELVDQFEKSAKASMLLNKALTTSKSFNEVSASVGKQKQALSELDKIKAQITKTSERLAAAQTLEAQMLKQLSMKLQEENQAAKDFINTKKAQEGSLAALRLQLKSLEGQYTALSRAERESGTGGQILKNLKSTYTEVINLEKAMGNHTRNVGNYASGWNGLSNSMNQITRELPAFGNSLQTGFMGISNNIPILFDAIKGVREQNAALRAEGKPTTSVLKQIAGAFFSWGTALSLGVTLLTLYGEEMFEFVKAMFKGTEALDKFARRQALLNEAYKSDELKKVTHDYMEMAEMIDAAQQGLLNKTDVLKHYNDTLGYTLGHTNDLDVAEQRLRDSLPSYIKMMAVKQAAQAQLNKAVEAQLELTRLQEMGTGALSWFDKVNAERDNLTPKQKVKKLFVSVIPDMGLRTVLGGGVGENGVGNESKTAYDKYLEKKKKDLEKILKDVSDLYKKLNEESLKIANQSGFNTSSVYGIGDKSKSTKNKKPQVDRHDYEMDALKKTKEVYQSQADTMRQITENEQVDYITRLNALEAYYAKKEDIIKQETKINNRESKGKLSKENAAIEIAELKKLELEKAETINKIKLDAQKDIEDNQKQLQQVREKQIEKQISDYERQSEAEQQIEAEKLNALKNQYSSGLITKEHYEKKSLELIREYKIKQLEIQIAYAEKELAIGGLSQKQHDDFLKRLNDLKNALADAKLPTEKKNPIEQYQQIADLGIASVNLLNEISTAVFNEDMARIEAKTKAIQSQYDLEKEAILQSGLSKVEEKRKLDALDAERARKQKALDRERVTAERRRAIFQKGVDIAEIIAQTALQVIKNFSNPVLAVTAGIVGAANLAKVIGTKLPQYATGREGGPAEYAEVNELGPELIVGRDGSARIANEGRRGITWLKDGDSVKTNKQLKAMVANGLNLDFKALNSASNDVLIAQKLDELIQQNKGDKKNFKFEFNSEYYTMVKKTIR